MRGFRPGVSHRRSVAATRRRPRSRSRSRSRWYIHSFFSLSRFVLDDPTRRVRPRSPILPPAAPRPPRPAGRHADVAPPPLDMPSTNLSNGWWPATGLPGRRRRGPLPLRVASPPTVPVFATRSAVAGSVRPRSVCSRTPAPAPIPLSDRGCRGAGGAPPACRPDTLAVEWPPGREWRGGGGGRAARISAAVTGQVDVRGLGNLRTQALNRHEAPALENTQRPE